MLKESLGGREARVASWNTLPLFVHGAGAKKEKRSYVTSVSDCEDSKKLRRSGHADGRNGCPNSYSATFT